MQQAVEAVFQDWKGIIATLENEAASHRSKRKRSLEMLQTIPMHWDNDSHTMSILNKMINIFQRNALDPKWIAPMVRASLESLTCVK